MARLPNDSPRFELRLTTADKILLTRAAAIKNTDVKGLLLQAALPLAAEIVENSERLQLSEKNSLRVLELLENPPAPNNKLVAAAKRMDARNAAKAQTASASRRAKVRVPA